MYFSGNSPSVNSHNVTLSKPSLLPTSYAMYFSGNSPSANSRNVTLWISSVGQRKRTDIISPREILSVPGISGTDLLNPLQYAADMFHNFAHIDHFARCPFMPSGTAVYFSTRQMTFTTSSMSIGFARWPFMPAAWAAAMSSAKALAVMATIGMVSPSGRSAMLRIAWVAS